MKTLLEREMELEAAIRAECKNKFPSLNPEWAIDRYYQRMRKVKNESIIILAEMALGMAIGIEERQNAKG